MGVPSFFAWWAKHYPEEILYKCLPYSDYVLLLDFNGAIHPAVRTDPTMLYSQMFAAVCDYLGPIIKSVKPKEVVIAIDGVAPVAKLSQQRERRYKSAKESKHKEDMAIEFGQPVRAEHVDFNMISPGTEYMYDLEQTLIQELSNATSKGGKWEGIKFSLNGSGIPGEGEHKIMDEIRSRKAKGLKEHYCIYGLDADLIFLSMENVPDCFLVRENVRFVNRDTLGFDPTLYPYIYLDIAELRDKVCKLLDPICKLNHLNQLGFKYSRLVAPRTRESVVDLDKVDFYHPERDVQRLVRDYIFICFMLGNDFLPRLPCLKIRNGSLNDIIVMYKQVAWKLGCFLVNADLTVNRLFFHGLLHLIASFEDEFMIQLREQRFKDTGRFKFRLMGKSKYEQAIEKFDYVENKYIDTIIGGTPGWRKRYYKYHMDIKYRQETEYKESILAICEEYIKGMNWVMQYYTGTHSNWSWFYPYDAAPTAKDLFHSLSELEVNYRFEDTQPVEPYVQLLSILPPDSAQLLPPTLRRLMTHDSPIHKMYPLTITLALNGNKFWHECKPKMPHVDHKLLNEVVDAKKCYFSDKERKRNSLRNVKVF